MDLVLKDECYKLVGACMRVHSEMGHGFLEAVYQECLEIELELSGIPFESQAPLKISYRSRELKQRYQPDFFVFGNIVVEIKAVDCLNSEFQSQVLNYLSAIGYPLGILINFSSRGRLEWQRIANTEQT